jgi:hypothetical protein
LKKYIIHLKLRMLITATVSVSSMKSMGYLSAVIRLDDKMRRLKQLLKQDAQVKDESIRDTVLDLANYAIMTVMELDNNK